MIRYRCSNCHEPLESPESMIGRMEKCPKCGTSRKVIVPNPARFKMRRAQTQEAIERQIRLGLELGDPAGFDLVVVTGPTTGCPDCDPLVGKVFSISGNSKRYPSIAQLNGGPPFHDECLHNIAPHMEELQDNPPPMVGFVNTATPAQDSTPKMSKAMKWAIGIGIFLALAVIGQLMKAAR